METRGAHFKSKDPLSRSSTLTNAHDDYDTDPADNCTYKNYDHPKTVEYLRNRIVELECVVADYARRFGLTELARKRMLISEMNKRS